MKYKIPQPEDYPESEFPHAATVGALTAQMKILLIQINSIASTADELNSDPEWIIEKLNEVTINIKYHESEN